VKINIMNLGGDCFIETQLRKRIKADCHDPFLSAEVLVKSTTVSRSDRGKRREGILAEGK